MYEDTEISLITLVKVIRDILFYNHIISIAID